MSESSTTFNHISATSRNHNTHRLSRAEFDIFIQRVNTAIDAESLAKDLLGQAHFNSAMSNSERLHFGRKGSLVVNTSGEYAGRFKSFESGKTGNLIQLVQHEKGIDFKSALTHVSSYVHSRDIAGQIDDFTQGKPLKERPKVDTLIDWDEALKDDLKERAAENETLRKVDTAKEIIAKTVPIEGTMAERYLREERCIKGELPDSLRYLPPGTKFHYNNKNSYVRDGALASIAVDSEGSSRAVQLTYLTKDGKRAETPDGDKFPKLTYGVLKGAAVQLQKGNQQDPTTIAEGVETALSLKEAGVKGEILCSLGTSNMKNLALHKKEKLTIVGDWDGSFDVPSWQSTEKAKAALKAKGNKVEIILPVKDPEKNPALANVKVDFNDLLKSGGVKSIVDRVSDRFPEVIGQAPCLREISPQKIASSPKPSPFKTNPFDMKLQTKNDQGIGI